MATVKKASPKRNKTAPASARKAKADEPVKTPEAPKPPKAPKRMRDTFSMPADEFDQLRKVKLRAKSLGVPVKKSDVLRAGLRTLQRMDDEQLAVLLASVQSTR